MFSASIATPATLHPIAYAVKLAHQLAAGETLAEVPTERWRYDVEPVSDTRAKVAAYDETGEFVAYF